MTALDSPRLVIRDLLNAEWDLAAYTDPFIHTGWHIPDQDQPEISCGPDNESPVGGGDTGFTGMNPATGQPTQQMAGSCQVHVWADQDEVGETENAKDVVDQYAEEVKRILGDFWNVAEYDFPAESQVDAAGYQYLSYQSRLYQPDNESAPVNHHYVITVGYGYSNR